MNKKRSENESELTSNTPSPWAICHYLWPGLSAHWLQLSLACLSMVGGVLLRLVEPWPLQLVIDNVVGGLAVSTGLSSVVEQVGGQTGYSNPMALLTLCAIGLVVIAIARAGVDYYRTVAFALIGNAVISDLRGRLYSHLQTLSLDFHSRTRSGDLTVRLTSDINMLKDVTVSAALPMVSSSLLLCGMLGIMLWVNWQLGIVILIAFPCFAWVTARSSRKIHHSARKQRAREGALASAAAESLGAVKSLQAQGASATMAASFTSENKRSHKEGAKTSRLMAGLERSVDVQIAIVTAIILWLGARSVLSGALTAGELVVYLAYLKRGFKPLQDFAKYTGRFSKAIAAGERITELMQVEPEITDSATAVAAPPIKGAISLDRIWLGFRRSSGKGAGTFRSVYENLSVHIDAGTSVAIVGPSGVGKSTLFSLILRLRDPDRGCLRIDGVDIREWMLQSLRQPISVILQENSIFATTVRENIGMFCPTATSSEIIAAAKAACAHEFIEQMPDGYETVLGERGIDLSQGQIQRIAIARVILKNSPIVLLDEPTSNLDTANRVQVISALQSVARDRTSLIITHELDLAEQCSHVLYLGKDHEVAFGSHQLLLRECQSYRDHWQISQVEHVKEDDKQVAVEGSHRCQAVDSVRWACPNLELDS